VKQSPRERRMLERMAAGALSRDGFLGDDVRPVAEIIDADVGEMERLGVTADLLAERLGEALAAAVAGLGRTVTVGETLAAVYREGMGRIPCPFGGCGTFQKGECELTDAATGERVTFTPLSVHMIASHGFFQGRGSAYRLEPAVLVRLFRLA